MELSLNSMCPPPQANPQPPRPNPQHRQNPRHIPANHQAVGQNPPHPLPNAQPGQGIPQHAAQPAGQNRNVAPINPVHVANNPNVHLPVPNPQVPPQHPQNGNGGIQSGTANQQAQLLMRALQGRQQPIPNSTPSNPAAMNPTLNAAIIRSFYEQRPPSHGMDWNSILHG